MDLFYALLIIYFGALIQTAFGFGLAVVGAPLLILISHDYVPGPISVAALFQSLAMMMANRRSMNMRGLKLAFFTRIPGSLCGVVLLGLMSPQLLTLAVGVMVLLSVVASAVRFKIAVNSTNYGIASFLSGLFGSSTSIGGPPMALLLQNETAENIRANLGAYFAYGCVVSLVLLTVTGLFTWHHLALSLPLIPAALLGVVTAYWLPLYRINHLMRPGILVLCSFAGIVALLAGIMDW